MGNKSSHEDNKVDSSNDHDNNCFITKDGEHVTREEIFRAGQAQARMDDHDSPGPIGDAISTLLQGGINWNAVPENIEGPCSEESKEE